MSNSQALLALPGNRLLAHLPEAEQQRLSSKLQVVALPIKQVLYKARSPLNYVYFPTTGVISAMTIMEDGSAIEVATIGNEGMAGFMVFSGAGTSPNEMMVQVSGEGLRMSADVFREECSRDSPLRRVILLYNTAFFHASLLRRGLQRTPHGRETMLSLDTHDGGSCGVHRTTADA